MVDAMKQLNVDALDQRVMEGLIGRLVSEDRPRYRRYWAYYRNPMVVDPSCPQRPYRQAQEWGLPTRITGETSGAEPLTFQAVSRGHRKEVVIENDIGWRIETMVDYLFGKPLVIRSAAKDADRRAFLDKLIQAILAHNGGIVFLQRLALLGAVYGFVDVLVKLDATPNEYPDVPDSPPAEQGQNLDDQPGKTFELGKAPRTGDDYESGMTQETTAPPMPATPSPDAQEARIHQLAKRIRLEIVEPSRALPILSKHDARVMLAYAQHYDVPTAPALHVQSAEPNETLKGWWRRWFSSRGLKDLRPAIESGDGSVTEIITADRWQRYKSGKLDTQGVNSLGAIPLVHIQNASTPFDYSGLSDVEPLIPLQDELNSRLSDRAHRISMQSFKMYLAKGIENFNSMPISPGQMWVTDNENGEIQEFGGDSAAPSESRHISDIREAMDKISGVSPIAAGAIKDRVGRLSSAAALRITLIALLAKTDRKRTNYGAGISRMIELALRWLDASGEFETDPAEREIEIHWPSPLPENDSEKLDDAERKLKIGVDKSVVLRELGY